MASSPQLPNEFFTLQSMWTLTGATGIVFVVANGLKVALDFDPSSGWRCLSLWQHRGLFSAVAVAWRDDGSLILALAFARIAELTR